MADHSTTSHAPTAEYKMGSGNELLKSGATPKEPANGFFASIIKGIFYPVLLIPAIVGCAFMYATCKIGDAAMVHMKKKRGESAIQEHHHSKLLQSWADFYKDSLGALAGAAFANTWVSGVKNICNFINPGYDHQADIRPRSKFLMGEDNEESQTIAASASVSSPSTGATTSPTYPSASAAAAQTPGHTI